MLRKTLITVVAATLAIMLSHNALAELPGPQVGQHFPHDLSAPDQRGEQQNLDTLMGEKGIVVLFVRSADWCPYCKRQLAEVNQRVQAFSALGLNVVAVSVDEVAEIAAFAEKQDIAFTLLADPAGDINGQLGIRDENYPLGHKRFGVPHPVLYVLDTDRVIRLAYLEP
ncbi:MAG: peroxiredoxin family protein, partial [Xanthomonadales bacterium]|nr:peroxiredoxin family protein [Xanthomonadales bacterium]